MSEEPVVLVVDDEAAAREGLTLALEGEDCRTIGASSAREALELVEREPVALILSDLRMPDMDGLQLLERVKKSFPDVEVVMITGFATIDTAVKAMRMGALEYICKPFKLDDVRRTVRLALKQQRLEAENRRLRRELAASRDPGEIIAESDKMRQVMALVDKVAGSRSNVLVTGESGVGKELVARTIHARGPRHACAFIPFNCAARAESLLESELFGFEKGAFTGADRRKAGIFENAGGGTVFLDEIGEIPLPLQVKLLRVINEKEITRLGGDGPVKVDFRLIAATNRKLEEEVAAARFREDLYYRLNVISIEVPPLRERVEDILPLARKVLQQYSIEEARKFKGFSKEAEDKLLTYPWPGNVRELQNVVERAVVLASGDWIRGDDLRLDGAASKDGTPGGNRLLLSLAEQEKRYIIEVLERLGGNRSRAARVLGLDRSSLWRKLKQYGYGTESNISEDDDDTADED